MSQELGLDLSFEEAADIVRDAGGKIVGRTRFQKIACLLEMAGYGQGFNFSYRHYGPFSDDLASAAKIATLLGKLEEEERPNSWGGTYSIFQADESRLEDSSPRRLLAAFAADADSVELELAVTAAFLATEGEADPWKETEVRKPEKASRGRLAKARQLYARLLEFETQSLPQIA